MSSRIAQRVLVGVLVGAIMLVLRAAAADAATYTVACPGAGDPFVHTDPVCERLELLVSAVEALPQTDTEHDYAAILSAIEVNTSSSSSGDPAQIAGVVELSPEDRERSDALLYAVMLGIGLGAGAYGLSYLRSLWSAARG